MWLNSGFLPETRGESLFSASTCVPSPQDHELVGLFLPPSLGCTQAPGQCQEGAEEPRWREDGGDRDLGCGSHSWLSPLIQLV